MSDVPIGNHYDKYAAKNPVARKLMDGFMRALDSALPTEAPVTVFELGMGEGEIADRIRNRYGAVQFTGLDLPDAGLARDWRERNLVGVFGDAGSLPIRDHSVDLVLAVEVLEHLPDPARAMRELARIARRDVVVSVPNEPTWRALNMVRGSYISDWGNTPGHIQHWSAKRFSALVGEHFDVVTVRKPLPWTVVTARARVPVAV
ncbi:MAG TPA: class I SAM-dependent methyltransferase [Acidimicrobiia bacterium]